jgi:antitoxin component YwqK of YwqJK toxin-antitoxin module
MKRLLLIVLLLSVGFPQTKMDINNLIERGDVLYPPNDNKPFSGSVFDFHENGTEKLNGRYRKGLKNGKWKWWNEDGGLDSTGSYRNGLMHGQWKFYFSNGNLRGKGQYRDGDGGNPSELSGIPLNGRYGKWTFWYENGQKRYERTYKDGEGFLTNSWDKNGKITVKNGNGLHTWWYENGQKSWEGTYKDGKLDGLGTLWYENGQKRREETFKDGEKISSKCWDEDGSEIEC